MIDDPKDAAHRLLFEQRDRLIRLRPTDKINCDILIAICDVLELQIRRIDELEAKESI